jgi:predicted acylesterase/phospholipase RssA
MAIPTPDLPQEGGSKPPRLGLAFSGGGFRASFFHIGMLAQLAQRGILRQVEVISTVSGGSILGALYYVHVKRLLEKTPDAEVTDQDYVAIVETIAHDFLKATQRNIRMLAFSSFKANWLKRRADYSTSDRLAELYNELLYQSVLDNAGDPIEMKKLKIFPPNQPDFHPNRHNTERKAKVPILVLNATTLNSGRNWRFTAQDMGEPRVNHNSIDRKSIRLKRPPSYDDIVVRQQNFRLGHAVAASACVPGLFPPMSITGLYQDGKEEVLVQLVDGGVHDNQGVGGLLDNGCTHFIVSDASQLMGEDLSPATDTLAVLLRTNSILQDRVRSVVLENLGTVAKSLAGAVHFVSLREGLGFRELFWNRPDGQPAGEPITIPSTTQDFNVDPAVQDLLSKVRTDLDAFSDVEAYSLMLDGYRVGGHGLTDAPLTVDAENWGFLKIQPWLEKPNGDYLKQLKVAKITFGKALCLIPWLSALTVAVIIALLVVLAPYILAFLKSCIPVLLIAVVLLGWAIDKLLPRLAKVFQFVENLISPWRTIKRWIFSTTLVLVGTLAIKFYLAFINPLFLKRGSFEALQRQGTPS